MARHNAKWGGRGGGAVVKEKVSRCKGNFRGRPLPALSSERLVACRPDQPRPHETLNLRKDQLNADCDKRKRKGASPSAHRKV